MNKARQGQLRRARSSADGFLSFINDYGFAVLSHRNRGCKTVRSGADHDRIIYVRLGHLDSTTTTAHCIFSADRKSYSNYQRSNRFATFAKFL